MKKTHFVTLLGLCILMSLSAVASPCKNFERRIVTLTDQEIRNNPDRFIEKLSKSDANCIFSSGKPFLRAIVERLLGDGFDWHEGIYTGFKIVDHWRDSTENSKNSDFYIKAIKTLLDAGADPNIEDERGNTILNGINYTADVIRLFGAYQANPNLENSNKELPILQNRYLPADVFNALIGIGANLNVHLQDGFTVFHKLFQGDTGNRNDEGILDFILSKDVSGIINQKWKHEETPLSAAIMNRVNPDAIKKLIRSGATVDDFPILKLLSPLGYIRDMGPNDFYRSVKALVDAGLNINSVDSDGRTALMKVDAKWLTSDHGYNDGFADIINALIQNGAGVNNVNSAVETVKSISWMQPDVRQLDYTDNSKHIEIFAKIHNFYGSTIIDDDGMDRYRESRGSYGKHLIVSYDPTLKKFSSVLVKNSEICKDMSGYEKKSEVIGVWKNGYILWCATADPNGPSEELAVAGKESPDLAYVHWNVFLTDKNLKPIQQIIKTSFVMDAFWMSYSNPIDPLRVLNDKVSLISHEEYFNGTPMVDSTIVAQLHSTYSDQKLNYKISWDGKVTNSP